MLGQCDATTVPADSSGSLLACAIWKYSRRGRVDTWCTAFCLYVIYTSLIPSGSPLSARSKSCITTIT
jgi:hypothetical protein